MRELNFNLYINFEVSNLLGMVANSPLALPALVAPEPFL